MEKASHQERHDLELPQCTVLVLCGPAGAGKSTFAWQLVSEHKEQGFHPTTIVSSDECRALICDDETNQQVNRDAFDLFYYIINKRMLQGRFTIADSTALQADARRRLLYLAHRHNYYTCIIVFNIPPEACVQQDRTRARMVGEDVIAYHVGKMQQVLQEIPAEGWHKVLLLEEARAENMHIHLSMEITGVTQ